jgi:hypothetical protein
MIDFFYDSWISILKFFIPGVFLGAVYDIFRLLRISRNDATNSAVKAIGDRYFPNRKRSDRKLSDTALVFMEDILFFVIVAITEILATYHINEGEIRIYGLMISAIGFFVYQKTLGRMFIFFSKKILYLIRRIIYLIACLVLTPVVFISRHLGDLRIKRKIKKQVIKNTRKDV